MLEKILLELKPRSPELRAEINEKESKLNGTDAKIVFKNTSVIKVVTASDTARGRLLPFMVNVTRVTINDKRAKSVKA